MAPCCPYIPVVCGVAACTWRWDVKNKCNAGGHWGI